MEDQIESKKAETAQAQTASVASDVPYWSPQLFPDGTPTPQYLAYHSQADWLGFGGAGMGGKALTLDTPLPTPTGWTTMGEVSSGDYLFDENGKPCQVIAVSDVMLNHTVYEVEFDDGSIIKADAEHKWLTMSYAEREANHKRTDEYRSKRRATRPSRAIANPTKPGVQTNITERNRTRVHKYLAPSIGEIRTTLEISETINFGRHANHSISVAGPLDLPNIDLPIHPYVLGVWLGDGSSYGQGLTCADGEIIERIESCGYGVVKWAEKYAYGIRGIKVPLREMGVLENKHIPDEYLRASIAQRWELLKGLMDTDGSGALSGSCEFYSTSRRLVYGVWELLLSLGIKCSVRIGRATLYGKDCGEKYRIKFTTMRPVFHLKRKLDRQVKKERGDQSRRNIVSVREIESEPVKCVAVNSDSRLYLAGLSMIPTHNTDLLLGLAGTQHRSSIIFRREFPQLRAMIERSREIFNAAGIPHAHDSYNESLHIWRLHHGGVERVIEFGAMQHEKDKFDHQGRPHDFYGFDEAPQLSESMVRFVTGWNRTDIEGQRCRVVLPFNPPFDETGDWITKMFLPWLSFLAPDIYQHPHPAKPGELRWYAVVDGKEIETDAQPFIHKGEMVYPKSRTFFPAKFADNPIAAKVNPGYSATIDAMGEPFASLMRGNWSAKRAVNARQVIRASSVIAAQARWTPTPPHPQTAIGADLARGGTDQMVIGKWHSRWLAPLVKIPGAQIPDGPTAAVRIIEEAEPGVTIGVDIIGIGASPYDALVALGVNPVAVNFGAGTSLRDKSERLTFRNIRAAAYWLFKEALEDTDSDIALPPDDELLADLCAVLVKNYNGGKVLLEEKEEVKARLGRSPDCADAVVIGWFVMMLEMARAGVKPRQAVYEPVVIGRY